jgi:ribosomal protein S18 acetylase RimI-like enzyme
LTDALAGVALRGSTPCDRAFLFTVYASTRRDELALTDWDEATKHAFLEQQFDAQDATYRARYPDGEFLIITRGLVSIGRLYLGWLPGEVRIVDITLLPEERAHGIGTKLIGDVMADAAARCCRVTLYVEAFNPAFRLYERLGFARIGEHGIYQLMEWRPPAGEGWPSAAS